PVALANAIAQATGLRDLVPPFTPPRLWMLMQGLDPDAVAEAPAPAPDQTELALAGHPLTGEGSVVLRAPRATVWRTLVEVEGLASIIPGCEDLRPVGPDAYDAVVNIRVAGIGGRYRAEIRLADQREPEQLRLVGGAEGKLGAGRGEALV